MFAGNYMNKSMRSQLVTLALLFLTALGSPNILCAEPVEAQPIVVHAKPLSSDPWYGYIHRPTKLDAEKSGRYSPEVLEKIPALTGKNSQHMPWSFRGIPKGPRDLFSLSDIIADKITDKKTGKTYNIMYHGTTSDLLDV